MNDNILKVFSRRIWFFPAIIIGAIGLLWIVFNYAEPQNIRLGKLENIKFDAGFGASSEELIAQALADLRAGNLETAVLKIEQELQRKEKGSEAFYLHYMAGQLYLHQSTYKKMGILYSVRQGYAEKAIGHFTETIRKNPGNKYRNVSLDASFYLAKAYILLGNKDAAAQYLQIVIAQKGAMMAEADQLMKKLK